MLLIGVNRPRTRAVSRSRSPPTALRSSSRALSGFGNRAAVQAVNALGRIPALVLDDSEVLVNSAAIVDHLDATHGGDRALTPAAGAERTRGVEGRRADDGCVRQAANITIINKKFEFSSTPWRA